MWIAYDTTDDERKCERGITMWQMNVSKAREKSWRVEARNHVREAQCCIRREMQGKHYGNEKFYVGEAP